MGSRGPHEEDQHYYWWVLVHNITITIYPSYMMMLVLVIPAHSLLETSPGATRNRPTNNNAVSLDNNITNYKNGGVLISLLHVSQFKKNVALLDGNTTTTAVV